jgi:hypothetical protein
VPIYYLDANVPVAVSQALAIVRGDILYPGALGCPVMSPLVPDIEWLEIAGREDWVVVTKDRKIRSRPGERDALIASGVRTFCATHAGNYTRWELLQLLVDKWDKIEEIATTCRDRTSTPSRREALASWRTDQPTFEHGRARTEGHTV